MRAAVRARLATALIPTGMSAVVTAYALGTNRWSEWGVEALPPATPAATSFGDLANITATAQCLTEGTDYTGCDPYGRAFQPYVVLPARILSALGIGTAQTGPLGIALAVVMVLTVAGLGLLLAHHWRAGTVPLIAGQLLLGVLALSAPVMLAIERGQIEILTLALAVLALWLMVSVRTAPVVLGAVAGVVAVVTKFFAVGLFAPFVRRGRANLPALIGLAVSVVFLLLNWSDLQQASTASRGDLPATSKSQFGAVTLVATILTPDPVGYVPSDSVASDWSTIRTIGWIVTLVAIVIAALLLRRSSMDHLVGQPLGYALTVGGVGVLALPYVLGASHDYRQVFLLPVAVGALLWVSVRPTSIAPWVMITGAALAMVTGAAMVTTPDGFIWPKIAMVLGDLGLLAVIATGAAIWVRGWGRRHV